MAGGPKFRYMARESNVTNYLQPVAEPRAASQHAMDCIAQSQSVGFHLNILTQMEYFARVRDRDPG